MADSARALTGLINKWRRAITSGAASIYLKTVSLIVWMANPARASVPLLIMGLLVPRPAVAAVGHWMQLSQQTPPGISLMLLLPDGSVLATTSVDTISWYRLTPDAYGSYLNGTWKTNAPMHYPRQFFSSQVLRDGRVFVAGSEGGPGQSNGEVYDPVLDFWTDAPVPQNLMDPNGFSTFNDAISEILPDGNVMVAPAYHTFLPTTLIYNPASNTWTSGPSVLSDIGNQLETSWVKLPDNSILTVDPVAYEVVAFQDTNFITGSPADLTNQTSIYFTNVFGGTNYVLVYPPNTAERYIPSLNQWVHDAPPPVFLNNFINEIGPALLLPDGRAFFLGASGHTAYYRPSGSTNPGTWAPGPDFPPGLGAPDLPAAMMVNGKILCAATAIPLPYTFTPPDVSFYEFDTNGPNGLFIPTGTPLDSTAGSTINPSASLMMLDLPDGNVLFSGLWADKIYVYVPDGLPLAAGKPSIKSVTLGVDNFRPHLTGTLLNGISEGAAFGDDAQMNSNYPLVRLTNSLTGKVYYARTHGWSSTGVMTGTNIESTDFTLPLGLPYGDYSLVVVANGISSDPVPLPHAPSIKLQYGHPSLALSWSEDLAGPGSQSNPPMFRVQKSSGSNPFSTGSFLDSPKLVRAFNGHYTMRDEVGDGPAFYRLVNVSTTNFIAGPATGPAASITANSASLTGSLTPIGSNTVYSFEYGTDTNYNQTTPTNSLATSANLIDLNLGIGGLTPLTLYHFQLMVTDDWGTQYGGDQQFTTLGLLPAVVTLDATYGSACPDCASIIPVLNGTVNADGSAHPAHARFEYGTDGITYPTHVGSYFTSTYASSETYNYSLTDYAGLMPNTTYHYRAVAFNDTGEGFGADKTFITPP